MHINDYLASGSPSSYSAKHLPKPASSYNTGFLKSSFILEGAPRISVFFRWLQDYLKSLRSRRSGVATRSLRAMQIVRSALSHLYLMSFADIDDVDHVVEVRINSALALTVTSLKRMII